MESELSWEWKEAFETRQQQIFSFLHNIIFKRASKKNSRVELIRHVEFIKNVNNFEKLMALREIFKQHNNDSLSPLSMT
jgi:hypothetical protein